jgi:hypothetical protein
MSIIENEDREILEPQEINKISEIDKITKIVIVNSNIKKFSKEWNKYIISILKILFSPCEHLDFSIFKSITSLTLNNNKLTSLNFISNCKNIKCLDVCDNDITTLKGCPPVLVLDISYNKNFTEGTKYLPATVEEFFNNNNNKEYLMNVYYMLYGVKNKYHFNSHELFILRKLTRKINLLKNVWKSARINV